MPIANREKRLAYSRKQYANLSPAKKALKLKKERDKIANLSPVEKAAHLEHKRKLQRRYRKTEENKERRRKYHRERKYGLTAEQWETLFSSQNQCCAICKAPEPGSKLGWHTDHCHSTGKVRGILCSQCNLMIGQAKDDERRLLDAACYLMRNREP